MENIAMYDIEQQTMCDQLLNTMADWLTLFSYFELRPYDGSNALCVRVAKNLENSSMLRRMQTSLTEAQVVPEGTMPHQRISMPQTALFDDGSGATARSNDAGVAMPQSVAEEQTTKKSKKKGKGKKATSDDTIDTSKTDTAAHPTAFQTLKEQSG